MTLPPKRLHDLSPDDAELTGAADLTITGLTADSREVAPGFLFAALQGENLDGRAFIPMAVEKGAAAVLLEKGSPVPENFDAVVFSDEPRRTLAQMAARFFDRQPDVIAAVTGTAGKSSVAAFLRQLWQSAGFHSASVGTVGVVTSEGQHYGSLTTPDPVRLHQTLADLSASGVTHLALEASSHGLDQCRLDGVQLAVAAFTNLGRDHMDYHPTMESYFDAKMRLFEVLLPTGAPAIVDVDSDYGLKAAERAKEAGARVLTVGEAGDDIRVSILDKDAQGQRLLLDFSGEKHELILPLIGRFQVANALVTAGLAYALGMASADAVKGLTTLKGEKGRLERIGETSSGALVFVDYAHKVEALENVLQSLRPFTQGKLTCVFGAGGDRDAGKRPLMGAVAARLADRVIVTDDNPRTENPALIRKAILKAAPDATEIGDREEAIRHALSEAGQGDVIVMAGKGHETGQIIGETTHPFSDHDVIERYLRGE